MAKNRPPTAQVGLSRERDVLVVEDEIYAPLLVPRPRPIVSFAPNHTRHVAGLSIAVIKAMATGSIWDHR